MNDSVLDALKFISSIVSFDNIVGCHFMLSQSQSIFLDLLTDYLNGQANAQSGVYDAAELAQIAHQQQCEGIVYYQTHLPVLQQAATAATYYSVQRRRQLLKIHDAFAAHGIYYILFKGTEIARYYPVPELRSMGDSDILVRPEDKKHAGKVLLSLGLTNRTQGGNEWGYDWNGIYYELHSRLMSDEAGNLPPHKAYMAEHWQYAGLLSDTQYRLDESYHFVYVLLHLRKHFINSGVGFRQFMDVAVMRQRCDLKWDWIEERLEELGITDFVKTCFALIERWFGIGFPITTEIDDAFYAEATEAIFSNGVFGFDNEKNRENYVKLQMRLDKHFKLNNIIRIAFPSYEAMRYVPYYEFVNGKPWLLPVAWVYRFFYKLLGKNARAALNSVSTPFTVTDSEVTDRINTLHKWGIKEF